MDNPTGQQTQLAVLEDFCFQDASHDNIFPHGDLLDRPLERNRKPDRPDGGREPRKELKDDELRKQIYAKVESLSGQPLVELWAQLNVQLKGAESSPPSEPKTLIPTEPPDGQLYENRQDKRQSAPDYISAVYKDFLNGTFTRADLRRIDPKADMALRNWERDHKRRADINLPTIKERNNALVAAGLIATDDPVETVRRARAAIYRAKK